MSNEVVLDIPTPRWALPLLPAMRYKGAKGGRASGKSHFFAELLVEESVADPSLQTVCIREIQKSLKFSAKKLIEQKIRSLGVAHMFKVLDTEIRRIGPGMNALAKEGIIIFQGMQDHTADSIKSLEGFDRAWVEEAQNMSARSIELLLPTMRAPGSQVWFSWNPDQEDDPVEKLFREMDSQSGVVVHVNFNQNPFCPKESKDEAKRHYKYNADTYDHVWLGGYNTKSEAIIFNGRWSVDEFEVDPDWIPLHGLDWGFSQDPTAAVRCYVEDEVLYIYQECGGVGIELDDTPTKMIQAIPNIEKYVIRADNARPESISYCKRHGLPRIVSCEKWKGCVEDGIAYIKSLKKIVIHPNCEQTIGEFKLYSYKVDKRTEEILPDIVDKHNHYIDALRYALGKLITAKGRKLVRPKKRGVARKRAA